MGRGFIKGIRLKNGERRYIVVLYQGRVDGREKRRWFRFSDRKTAEAFAGKMSQEMATGAGMIPDAKLTVEEYLKAWLGDQEGRIRLSSKLRYEELVNHVIAGLGHLKLSRLSPSLVESFYRSLERDKGLSGTTCQHVHRVLHVALRSAMRKGLIARNVASPDFVQPPRRTKHERAIWDFEQIRTFLGQAKLNGNDYASFRNYTMWLFALCTGTRSGEIAGLKWSNVDLGLNLVRIDSQLQRNYSKRVKAEDKVQLVEPKSESGKRTIPLIPLLAEELRRLKERQDELKRKFGEMYETSNFVFTQPDGKPVHTDNIRCRAWKDTITDAKLPYIRPHDLRHCCGSFLTALGVDPATVAAILGHSDKSFTMRQYIHEVSGVKEAAMKKLEQALFGERNGK